MNGKIFFDKSVIFKYSLKYLSLVSVVTFLIYLPATAPINDASAFQNNTTYAIHTLLIAKATDLSLYSRKRTQSSQHRVP